MNTGYQLMRLFSIILAQCGPLLRTLFAITNPTKTQIEDYGLYLLNQLLQESGKSLTGFPLCHNKLEIGA